MVYHVAAPEVVAIRADRAIRAEQLHGLEISRPPSRASRPPNGFQVSRERASKEAAVEFLAQRAIDHSSSLLPSTDSPLVFVRITRP